MRRRRLGTTDILVSELGLGCASYWGKREFPEDRAIGLVHRAVELGVNFFDTGHSYSDGNAEPRLGKALARLARQHDDVVISTKCGTRIGAKGRLYKDFSPAWIRESVALSLTRLGVQHVDLLQLHGPTIADMNDDALESLHGLKQAGLVRAIGVNSFDEEVLEHVLVNGAFDFVMPEYNLLAQESAPLIRRLAEARVGVLAGAPLADGLYSRRIFAPRNRKDVWYLARALHSFRGKLMRGRKFRFVDDVPGMTGAQVAIAYVLANQGVTSAVFGTTSLDHLEENLAASTMELPGDLVSRIEST